MATPSNLTANQQLIQELSDQAVQLSYQISQTKSVNTLLTREKKKDELTIEDLKDMPDDHVAYKAVGRLFVKKAIPDLRKDLHEHSDYCETELKGLKEKGENLSKKMGDIENQLREALSKEK